MTREELRTWLLEGMSKRATHMIVVCDTFDHDDYPVYAMSANECLDKAMAPGEMQRVMEVYDLAMDIDAQLRETRAMHLPVART